MNRYTLCAIAVSSLLLGGCAGALEPKGIAVYPSATTEGVGWAYRADDRRVEPIMVGAKAAHDLTGDVAALSNMWKPLDGRVRLSGDGASQTIIITLDDSGTGRLNPFRGGFLSWDMSDLRDRLLDTFRIAGIGADPHYSIHLLAVTDDSRPLVWNGEQVAQVRVRRLAKFMMEDGIDPRAITAQVIPAHDDFSWKLAIVLRPSYPGAEDAAARLITPAAW